MLVLCNLVHPLTHKHFISVSWVVFFLISVVLLCQQVRIVLTLFFTFVFLFYSLSLYSLKFLDRDSTGDSQLACHYSLSRLTVESSIVVYGGDVCPSFYVDPC